MSLRIPLPNGNFLTLISTYAPTLDSEEPITGEFYYELSELIFSAHTRDKLIILGDFNTRVVNDTAVWGSVIGHRGHNNCNGNELRLLGMCTEH